MKCRERDIYHSINHPDWNRYYIAIGEINQCTYEMKGITEEELEKVYFKRRVTRVNNLFRKTIKEFSYERCNLFISSRKTALYKTKVYFYTNGRILLLRDLKPILKRFYHLPYLEYIQEDWLAPDLKPHYVETKQQRARLKELIQDAIDIEEMLAIEKKHGLSAYLKV